MINKVAKLTRINFDSFHNMLMSLMPQARAERLAEIQKLVLYEPFESIFSSKQVDCLSSHLSAMQLVDLDVHIFSSNRSSAFKLAAAIPTGTIQHLCLLVEDKGYDWMDLVFSLSSTLHSLHIEHRARPEWRKPLPDFQSPIFSVLELLKVRCWSHLEGTSPNIPLAIVSAAPRLLSLELDGDASVQLRSLLKQCGSRLQTLGLSRQAGDALLQKPSLDLKKHCPHLPMLKLQGEIRPSYVRQILLIFPPMPGLEVERIDELNLRDTIEDLQSDCAHLQRLKALHATIIIPVIATPATSTQLFPHLKAIAALMEIQKSGIEIERSIEILQKICEERKVALVVKRIESDSQWNLRRLQSLQGFSTAHLRD